MSENDGSSKTDFLKVYFSRTTKEIEEIIEGIRQKNILMNKELRQRAKPKEELIVPVEGIITAVTGYAHNVYHTPDSERIMGGVSPSYKAGMMSSLEIAIESNSPVKIITFYGWPPLETGDAIRAYVFKGKEECERELYRPFLLPRFFFTERDFQEKEAALKIEKLRDSKIIAVYFNN